MTTSVQVRSTFTNDGANNGTIEVSLAEKDLAPLNDDDVLIRVEATPINPSDLGTLLGPADMENAKTIERDGQPILSVPIPAAASAALAPRIGQALPVGNEGAGIVIEAGSSPQAQALIDKTVAVFGGAMYATHRSMPAANCLEMPSGTSPRDAASCFVNPLTALGMVETMKLEGHSALVHTAAASNLGQMLNKLCLADDVPLVNIVRKAEQADLLKKLGARHVCNSSEEGFEDELTDALDKTGATIAFDAIGGGVLADQILNAMERVVGRSNSAANRYGSTTHKQVYLYGMLDTSTTVLTRTYGMAWGVGAWLLPNFLARVGNDKASELRQRVSRDIKTTFSSNYTEEIALADVLDADIARRYQRKSTGEKFLVRPQLRSS